MSRSGARGFVLPVVAGLVALALLLVGGALLEAAQGLAFSQALRLRQQAFEAAESGLAQAVAALRTASSPPPQRRWRTAGSVPADVALELVARDALPAGFSARRLEALRYRIVSAGRAPRGISVTVEAGYTRLEALP